MKKNMRRNQKKTISIRSAVEEKDRLFRATVKLARFVLQNKSTTAFELIYTAFFEYESKTPGHIIASEFGVHDKAWHKKHSDYQPKDVYAKLTKAQKIEWDNNEALRLWRDEFVPGTFEWEEWEIK